MTEKRKADLDPAPANDKAGSKGVAPSAKGIALAPTAALATMAITFKNIDTTAIGGRSALPLLQFKSREDGTWMFGQRRTIPEADSLWGLNIGSFKWGRICWGDGNMVLSERLVPISQPLPDLAELPDKGFPWQQEMAVNLKCISGTDVGAEVVFKITTEGGKGEVIRLIEAIRDRLNSGQHDGKIAPIVRLEKDSYPHPQYGRTWTPLLTIVDWMGLDGPEAAPVPAPISPSSTPTPAAEQPRRRRIV